MKMKLWEILKEENKGKKYRDNKGRTYILCTDNDNPILKEDGIFNHIFSQSQIMKLDFEEVQTNKTGWEKGKIYNSYYHIDSSCEISESREVYTIIDNKQYEILNYFSTKEKAEEVNQEQLLYRKMKKFYDTEDGQVDWDDKVKEKYYVYYDFDDNTYDIECNYTCKNINTIYFSSYELTQRCIDEVIIPFYKNNK